MVCVEVSLARAGKRGCACADAECIGLPVGHASAHGLLQAASLAARLEALDLAVRETAPAGLAGKVRRVTSLCRRACRAVGRALAAFQAAVALRLLPHILHTKCNDVSNSLCHYKEQGCAGWYLGIECLQNLVVFHGT